MEVSAMRKPTIPALLPPPFLLALLLAAPAIAQTTSPFQGTLPAGREWIEASGRTHVPFGLQAGISQQVWDTLYTPGEGKTVLYSAFTVRRDGIGGSCGAFWVECEIGFSSTSYSYARMSGTFARNRGKDFSVVHPRRRISFPATAATGKPSDFLPPFPFARPFMFQRLQAVGLLMETRVFSASASSPGQNFTLDALGPAMSIRPPRGFSAPGCKATPYGKPLDCALSVGGLGGVKMNVTVKEAAPNSPVVLFLGRSSSRWGNIPLPLDLGPMGAPTCFAYVDHLVHLTGNAGGQGTWTTSLSIPSSAPSAYPVYAQAYVPAAGMNPLGLAASNGAVVLTIGVPPTSWVYDTSSPSAVAGTVRKYTGPVIALNYL
jgi:hypothetical protein